MENTTGKKVGYIRVSSVGQNTERQLQGVELDKVFEDKVSGKDTNRPALQEMLKYVREGDSIICHSLDRFARSLTDLKKMVQDLTNQGIEITFIKEGLTFNGKKNAMNDLLLGILGSISEFERNLIAERRDEGIAIAKANGKYKGRARAISNDTTKTRMLDMIKDGDSATKVAKAFSISRATLYRYIKESKVIA